MTLFYYEFTNHDGHRGAMQCRNRGYVLSHVIYNGIYLFFG
jgi:hypothetical protein